MANIDHRGAEEAIVALLEAALENVATVESYSGQDREITEGRLVQFPHVAVQPSSGVFEMVDGPNWSESVEFQITVYAHHLSGEKAARLEPVTGAYAVLAVVKDTLINAVLGENAMLVKPVRWAPHQIPVENVSAIDLFLLVDFDQEYEWGT